MIHIEPTNVPISGEEVDEFIKVMDSVESARARAEDKPTELHMTR